MLTPPPPTRNALTEFSITPFCQKTSSVLFDGKDFRAATLDAELANELDGTTISEMPQVPFRDHYVVYWYHHPRFKGIDALKASTLYTADQVPLYTEHCWNPSLIPHSLRQSTAANAQAAGTSSKSSGRCKKSARTSVGRTSLRCEPVTWRIPGTNAEETLEAMLIPVTGAEESDISKWLNMIIDSFNDLSPPRESNPKSFGPAVPEGWDGLHLTRSMTKASSNAAANRRLHSWSMQYATKPVENSHLNIKPDIVFCSQPDPKSGFAWHNVISFLELTSSPYSVHLQHDITWKVYAVFTLQPARRFVVALSLACQDFRLHIFDRSGAIHSLAHNIHKSANSFCRLLYVFTFGRPEHLGFNPTFLDPSLSPSSVHQPLSIRAVMTSWTVQVSEEVYTIVRPIFVSHLIQGRGTNSWLVRKGRKFFVIKDYWTHTGRRHMEEEMLKKIKGLDGVPTLVAAWTVQTSEGDETTDLIWPRFLVQHATFETCIH